MRQNDSLIERDVLERSPKSAKCMWLAAAARISGRTFPKQCQASVFQDLTCSRQRETPSPMEGR